MAIIKTTEMVRAERRQRLIKALAEYLVGNQAGKSIALTMSVGVIPWAQEWAKVRSASGLFGYPTVEEAERQLNELFFSSHETHFIP